MFPAGERLECNSDVSLDALTDSDVINLQCHIRYDHDFVYTQFSCSTEPQTVVEPGHMYRNISSGELRVVAAYYSQRVQVDRRLDGGRLMCIVQFISIDVDHKLLYTSSWTSPSVTVTGKCTRLV